MNSKSSISTLSLGATLATLCLSSFAPADEVIAAYSFDDGTAKDNSGNGNDGTAVGVTAAEGKFGDALLFAGNDSSYVVTPDLGTHDELTVAAWFKVTGRVGQWRVIYNVDGWSAGWLHHQLYPDNRLGFSINSNPGGNDRHSLSRFDVAPDDWHHSACVYSSADMSLKFYIDGVLDVEHAWGGSAVNLSPGRIGGWNSGGRAFQGLIDEVVFLDYAATADEVVALMNGGIGENGPFQISDIELVGEAPEELTEVVLRWDSKPGRTYAVDRTSDPGGEWEELDDGVAATGESTEYRDDGLPEPVPRTLLYRVRELE